jgi:hypothetical protein
VWVVYAFAWDVVTFRPDSQELVVSYKITSGDSESKKGVVRVANTDKVLRLRILQSIKNATGKYLDQYNENIKAMSKAAVDKIIADITAQNMASVQ